MHLCRGVWGLAALITIGIAVQLFTYFPLFAGPECPKTIENPDQLPRTGLYLMRNAADKIELQQMQILLRRLPNVTADKQMRCGCYNPIQRENPNHSMPKTLAKLRINEARWAMHLLPSDDHEFTVKDADFIASDPSHVPRLLAKKHPAVGYLPHSIFHIAGSPAAYLAYELCWSHKFPGYENEPYRGWHVDRSDYSSKGVHSGRFHRFFLMLEKSPEDHLSSNLHLLPRDASKRHKKWANTINKQILPWIKRVAFLLSCGGLWESVYTSVSHQLSQAAKRFMGTYWYLLLNNYGCVVAQDPGDILFFAEDILHKTQNRAAKRIAYSMVVRIEKKDHKHNARSSDVDPENSYIENPSEPPIQEGRQEL